MVYDPGHAWALITRCFAPPFLYMLLFQLDLDPDYKGPVLEFPITEPQVRKEKAAEKMS